MQSGYQVHSQRTKRYTGKMGGLAVAVSKGELGGAGGIRTHEWRFCRPLPWATWVPRRISKYSKSSKTLRSTQPTGASFHLYFLLAGAGVAICASRRKRADSSGGVGLM